MTIRPSIFLIAGALLTGSTACTTVHRSDLKSNALEYLYPRGRPAQPPSDVTLTLPVRVGVAFAPGYATLTSFTETQKEELLGRIVDSFTGREGIASVQAIPTAFLSPAGGFENVERLVPAFGIDLIALVSYDQFQASETGRSSWTYWTLVGIYVVKGEKNETRTVMNSVIFDIPSRAMLFNASGQSLIKGKSLPVQVEKALRERSEQGFDAATDDMIANLHTALDEFLAHAATGTVRGPGTPAISMVDVAGQAKPLPGAGGSGALPLADLLGLVCLVSLACVPCRG